MHTTTNEAIAIPAMMPVESAFFLFAFELVKGGVGLIGSLVAEDVCVFDVETGVAVGIEDESGRDIAMGVELGRELDAALDTVADEAAGSDAEFDAAVVGENSGTAIDSGAVVSEG